VSMGDGWRKGRVGCGGRGDVFFFENFEICREVCFRRKYVEAEEDDDTLVYGCRKNPQGNHKLYIRYADTVQV
jgi:hypothetical protein